MGKDLNHGQTTSIDGIFFDFGGVVAEEGFHLGLHALAVANKLDPLSFTAQAESLIFTSGYLTGQTAEAAYWRLLREHTGITGSDEHLRQVILREFRLRAWMLELIASLRGRVRLGILSDQTNWLDELNAAHGFFALFDVIINSYHLGKSKQDASVFTDACALMGTAPARTLFVDDRPGNIERASSLGLHTIHYTGQAAFLKEIVRYVRL